MIISTVKIKNWFFWQMDNANFETARENLKTSLRHRIFQAFRPYRAYRPLETELKSNKKLFPYVLVSFMLSYSRYMLQVSIKTRWFSFVRWESVIIFCFSFEICWILFLKMWNIAHFTDNLTKKFLLYISICLNLSIDRTYRFNAFFL